MRTTTSTGILILSTVLCFSLLNVPLRSADNPPSKPAELVFKNIQALKGVPSEQIIPAMQFITASLGVECDFCHVPGAFEKDDKKPKQTARKMMLMMFAINRDNFEGQRKVTCYSCHRGNHKPLDTPIVTEEPPASAEAGTAMRREPDSAFRSAEQIVERYVVALGGKAAIQGVSSRIASGKAEIEGREFPTEIFYDHSDKISTVIHLPNGENVDSFNGRTGWVSFPGHSVRAMEPYEINGARIDADLHLPLDLQQPGSEIRVISAGKIGAEGTYMGTASWQGQPLDLYFDKDSGLLVRLVRYVESPLGRSPVQTDYSDYRQSGTLKIPFRWTVARPGGRFTIQLERVKENVAIEPARFEKPVAQEKTDGH